MRRLAVLAAVAAALVAPTLAHAAPPIQRPNPATYPVTLDYTNPLPGPGGAPATLSALDQGVITAATADHAFLAYHELDDLGGFMPAPVGSFAISGNGQDLLSSGITKSQIPLLARVAGGEISSYAFALAGGSGGNPPADNGKQPIPGLGPPPPTPAPTNSNTVPPANQGFGGKPGGGNGNGGGTGTQPTPPPTTSTTQTTTTTTTAATATTTTTSTTTTGGGGSGNSTGSGGGSSGGGSGGCSGGSCAAGSCGVPGIEVDSTASGCTIAIPEAVPGDSISETWTITNTTGAPYTLSLEADATPSNQLLTDLEMGVWDATGPAPVTLPPLTSWVAGYSTLTTLNPGQSVKYEIELYLPTTAGNGDQGKTVSITFHWHAQG